ncbi:tyrosine-protein kinase receptor Tie-1-like [Paramacrobiotus metropolitanus]|uniref:tyrosine-protein kinase receptor Tie-1-like n=1 Tax=Paramacrobiotus metropolitanus TaxID=2943436 RepID=UPI002445655B|nr:tyrosine-protein kinase receptor Tie-1-like [Paramacrobiotus metropolitanus]
MKIMTKAGRHLNIINLVGAVFKDEILLLLEYSEYGALLKLLKSHRGMYFYNQTDHDGKIKEFNEVESLRMQHEVDEKTVTLDEQFDKKILSTKDLLNFAFQISCGMSHLNNRSIIHRDLAARNILVCHERVVKIADFGMAKQLPEYVLVDAHIALPVRWMSPESIIKRVFNQKSDVWSFGVLMWELFTLGETPYSNCSMDITYMLEFLSSLTNGFRMDRPPACSTAIYEMMLSCWLNRLKHLKNDRSLLS